MIPDWLDRTKMMIGEAGITRLRSAHVLVVGLGGVGSAAAEMLCRAGVGTLTVADSDTVQPGNLNRQLIATTLSLGKKKTEVTAERLRSVNPEVIIHTVDAFLKDESMIRLLDQPYDYIVDAIDTLSPKVYLLVHAIKMGHRLVSSMGSGAKLNPSLVKVADISETHTCTFAHDVRKRLRRLGIHSGIRAVFSSEAIIRRAIVHSENERNKKSIIGTISYMPVVFGCNCAAEAVISILGSERQDGL